MMRYLLLVLLLATGTSIKAQYLSWYISAQTGSCNYGSPNINGSVLAGFQTEAGQQFSVGPVIKSYMSNQRFGNIAGLRVYSQTSISEKVNLYMQCDVSNGTQFAAVSMKSPLRLETGIGINYMIGEKIGVGAGYNFGDYNPLSNMRKSSPALKLVYLVPFKSNSWGYYR
ncbi:hypothetical protein [Arcticibacter sp. MXS-1]|uniref:hypothetical protein n=1 Tax=Arcticibacter sp. MXS-1 TaxID=3341726 RepID=UPI0035A984FA